MPEYGREQIADLPDLCPKGHRIWWFSLVDEQDGCFGMEYGLCAGKATGGKWPSVEARGACRFPWRWDTRTPGAALDIAPQLNVELLVRMLRTLAYQAGVFRFLPPEEPRDGPSDG